MPCTKLPDFEKGMDIEMEKLAILGGKPVRKSPLSYGKQWIDEDDIKAVTDVLRGDYLTCGPWISKLEQKLCEVTGAKFAVAVSNGTAALHIAALAAGLQPGDEAITTPITFAASANCILYCGATPVFADIEEDTYNIDPNEIEKKITAKTKAIIAVDFSGQAAELYTIKELARKHQIIVIEDAAHSIGTIYDGKPVGSIADMTTFSFHPVKTVTCGEGGAVTTNDESLYRKLLLYRSHGITRDTKEMVHPSEDRWYNEQVALGYNYRMTDFQAALLSSQLNKLSVFSNSRKALAKRYDEAFRNYPELVLQKENPLSDSTRHLYIIRLNLEGLTCNRKEFFDALWEENIHCQVHYIPVYLHSYYESLGYEKGLCKKAEKYYEEALSIPYYPALTEEDVTDTITAIEKVLSYYRKVQ